MPHHIPIFVRNKYIVSCFSDDTILRLKNTLKRYAKENTDCIYKSINGEHNFDDRVYDDDALISSINPFPLSFLIDCNDNIEFGNEKVCFSDGISELKFKLHSKFA